MFMYVYRLAGYDAISSVYDERMHDIFSGHVVDEYNQMLLILYSSPILFKISLILVWSMPCYPKK